jgi:hypothetical protein
MNPLRLSNIRQTVNNEVLTYIPAEALPTALQLLREGDFRKVLVEGTLRKDPGGQGYMLEVTRTSLA